MLVMEVAITARAGVMVSFVANNMDCEVMEMIEAIATDARIYTYRRA